MSEKKTPIYLSFDKALAYTYMRYVSMYIDKEPSEKGVWQSLAKTE